MRLSVLSRFAVLASVGSVGCGVPKGQVAVDAVSVHGAHSLDPDDITDRLATAATPKFLGLFRGAVYDYALYDESVLQRDLARVERYYRGRGFLEAHARAARVTHLSADHVRVDIVVDEGPPTLNRLVQVDGLDTLPVADADAVRTAARDALPTDVRFDEDDYKKAQDAVTRELQDRGYAYAKLNVAAQADLGAHAIDYVFTVAPGIHAVFGAVTIVGLDADGDGPKPAFVEEPPIRRALDIREGERYSAKAIESATQALLDLDVFSSVTIEPTLPDPPSGVIPLVVHVEPAKLRLTRLGGGAEFDAIKTEIHGLVGWEDHDFLGGLRDFTVEFKPGAVLYPARIGDCCGVSDVLPEERLRLQLRQPGFLEARTVGFIQPEFNVYPLQLESNPIPTDPVVGYVEPKAGLGLNRRFGKHVNATLAYNVQAEVPFTYVGQPNADLGAIVLLFPQLITTLDLRDNPVHPHAGIYLSNDLQVAGFTGAGLASDVRVQPEARGYIPLARGITLAVKGKLGFLFADNYSNATPDQSYRSDLESVRTGHGVNSSAPLDRSLQLVYFRGFFSGGPSSNRGFPLRGVSPYGIIPFLSPVTGGSQLTTCGNGQKIPVKTCDIPLGGFSLWEASVEVRFDVSGPLGLAAFCDTGDVSSQVFDIRPKYLHMSCGGGFRYQTPVGPVRLDVGYRIQPLQVLGTASETEANRQDPTVGLPPTFLGQPIAVAFGIGEAF
ncbi:MAG TPA: BamA/TamA family outer membrane protein [Polyangiaceae bacterium]|jgi:outer membrane translocation and assembly module TamA